MRFHDLFSLAPRQSPNPGIVTLADRMERDGWVTRRSDLNDGRANLVVPTAEATNIWGQVSQMVRVMLNKAYRRIHPAEIETVKRVLGRVRRNLGA